jgi:hypothetical protein
VGCLCRKHFPGLVYLKEGRWEPAWSWDRYKLDSDDKQDNKQERVLADFLGKCLTMKLNTSPPLVKSFIEIMNGYIVFVCRSTSRPKKVERPWRIKRHTEPVRSTSVT